MQFFFWFGGRPHPQVFSGIFTAFLSESSRARKQRRKKNDSTNLQTDFPTLVFFHALLCKCILFINLLHINFFFVLNFLLFRRFRLFLNNVVSFRISLLINYIIIILTVIRFFARACIMSRWQRQTFLWPRTFTKNFNVWPILKCAKWRHSLTPTPTLLSLSFLLQVGLIILEMLRLWQ